MVIYEMLKLSGKIDEMINSIYYIYISIFVFNNYPV